MKRGILRKKGSGKTGAFAGKIFSLFSSAERGKNEGYGAENSGDCRRFGNGGEGDRKRVARPFKVGEAV